MSKAIQKAKQVVASKSERTPPENAPLAGRIYVNSRNQAHKVKRTYWGKQYPRSEPGWMVEYHYDCDDSYTTKEPLEEWLCDDPILVEQPSLGEFQDWAVREALSPPTEQEVPDEEHASTALTTAGTKDTLLALQRQAESTRQRAELIRRGMEARMARFRSQAHAMESQLRVIRRNLDAIELYLGVYEEIFQVSEGDPAPVGEPVTFRQLVIYIDEEVGDPRPKDGVRGIDYSRVEEFDGWLRVPANLNRVAPEARCVVLMQPSRHYRRYSENWFEDSAKNDENKMSYLLIRNGARVYRIWTSIPAGRKLFPGPEELSALFASLRGSRYEEERAREKEFGYKRLALLLQGLLDRTEVLQPLPVALNLFDPDTYGESVRFVYDAEPALGDGRIGWKKWKEARNSGIQVGSRIVVADNINDHTYHGGSSWTSERLTFYTNKYYERPKPGIYTVYPHPHKKDGLCIRYNPEDTVYWRGGAWGGRWDPHDRERRLSFVIRPDDDFVLLYDGIDTSDIDRFIEDRLERENYLRMMPTLWEIRDRRHKELRLEAEFVKLVAGRNGVEEAEVWRAVEWWKQKVKWKRGLTSDDAKALRMIERWLAGGYKRG